MPTTNHSKVRFIGYAISTGPLPSNKAVGDGTYLGNANDKLDMQARVVILKNAVDQAKSKLPMHEDISTVTNIFMAPEFFFHGKRGPYIYASEDSDPLIFLSKLLAETFNSQDYPNWTFIFGTAVTAKVANVENVLKSQSVTVRNAVIKTLAEQLQVSSGATYMLVLNALKNFINDCQDAPNIIVRDRALIVSNLLLDAPCHPLNVQQMMTEKYFISGEDFLLSSANPNDDIVTEQMAGYDRIDLSNGDLKKTAFDPFSIFRQNYGAENMPAYMDFAVEICLDHDDARLRLNNGLEPFPKKSDSIHVQLIPSYGSQINQSSVVAGYDGFVFNCDGQSLLDESTGPQSGNLYGVESIYVNYSSGTFCGHTQLARVKTPAVGNNPSVDSASFYTLSSDDVLVVNITPPSMPEGTIDDYFTGGAGAVHIYGCMQPFTLSPSSNVV